MGFLLAYRAKCPKKVALDADRHYKAHVKFRVQ